MSIIQSVPRYGHNAAALLGCVKNETDSDQVIVQGIWKGKNDLKYFFRKFWLASEKNQPVCSTCLIYQWR